MSGHHDSDPFLPTDIQLFPKTKALTQQITDAINKDITRLTGNLLTFCGRCAAGSQPLVTSARRSEAGTNDSQRTTTRMMPEEIHQLGLREVDQNPSRDDGHRPRLRRPRLFRASLNESCIPPRSKLDDFRRYIG